MAWKYYRKLSPDTKPVLSNGASVKFTTLDNVVGYFATDNEYLHSEFERFNQEQKYGVVEIPQAEYEADYVQKKSGSEPLRKPWREEIGPGASALQQVSQIKQSVSAAVAVSGTDVPQKRAPVVASTLTKDQAAALPGQAPAEFKPKTVKRGGSKQK